MSKIKSSFILVLVVLCSCKEKAKKDVVATAEPKPNAISFTNDEENQKVD
ncbi:MAG: hypothetical protein HKM92_00200, partial [Arenibacter sp.]|nr:hypothetical protein [Arenibacter sp.]